MTNLDQDIEFDDAGGRLTFDFRGFLFKILQNWILIAISIAIALGVAHYINVRKQNIYRLNALVSVESEQNPFFTANTSISFNWGGVSGKIGKVMTTLATRSHNELVIDSLQFYKQYLKQGKYHLLDIYKASPFDVKINKGEYQMLGRPIELKHLNNNQFQIIHDFEETTSVSCQRYSDRSTTSIAVNPGVVERVFTYGEPVNLPFFNGVVKKRNGKNPDTENQYFIHFLNFDGLVSGFQNSVNVSFFRGSSTVLSLAQSGNNKAKIVDYLNATAEILRETELRTKNLYATNTIAFIDSTLGNVNSDLKDVNQEMDDFRSSNKVFNVSEDISNTSEQLKEYENSREVERTKINYLNNLESYLQNKTDYTNIAAPTSVGIEETGLLTSIGKLTTLAIERENQSKTAREGSILLRRLDAQIDAEKNVVFELINAARRGVNSQLGALNSSIAKLEAELRKLPQEQQEFLKIQRKLDISQEAYNIYQAKLSEAEIVKAANVSDIVMIDPAKDIGNGPIGPKKSLNYMMALVVGGIIPVLIIFLLFILDRNIHTAEDVERLSKLPVIGLVGKYTYKNNLVAFEKPKSAVAESFRAIRSSLQFIYKNQKDANGSKTLMFTSSISGEGKTFCSINTATVYALSGKKTVIVGLDLRKPKIFDDFDVKNDIGVVNYLINDGNLEDITRKTHIPNLDIILSGPIPPNPSELLMSKRMSALIAELKTKYDMIILDTSPLGLVTDALELSQHADATIYMVRLNYTKKGMLSMVNSKYKKGELKNVNLLLNFYRHKKGAGYGYGYGYGYGAYGDSYLENEKRGFFYKIKRLLKR